MHKNPYPQNIEDEASGVLVTNDEHRAWQGGYEAGWNEAKAIVQKVNAEAGDLRVFERMILVAFVSQGERGEQTVRALKELDNLKTRDLRQGRGAGAE